MLNIYSQSHESCSQTMFSKLKRLVTKIKKHNTILLVLVVYIKNKCKIGFFVRARRNRMSER